MTQSWQFSSPRLSRYVKILHSVNSEQLLAVAGSGRPDFSLTLSVADGTHEGRTSYWTAVVAQVCALETLFRVSFVQLVAREWATCSGKGTDIASHCMCEKAGWLHSLAVLAGKANYTPDVATAAIDACSKAKKWDRATEMLKDMRNMKLEPNLVAYNALATAQWQYVINLFSMMHVRSIEADRRSCTSLIHRVGCSALWLKASLFFHESRRKGIICDVVSCNSAMSACDSAFEWSGCLEVFEELKRFNVQRNIMALNTVLSAYGRMDLWECTLASLELVKTIARGLQPTLVTRSIVMSACTFVGQWAFALHQMSFLSRRESVKMGNMAISSLGISACALGSLWEQALSLCIARCLEGKVKVSSFNNVIAVCGRQQKWQWALWLLKLADRTNQEIDAVTYTTAISACQNQWQHALLVFSNLKSSNLEAGVSQH